MIASNRRIHPTERIYLFLLDIPLKPQRKTKARLKLTWTKRRGEKITELQF